jgi:acetyltransferase-like isoleucine patch superfamily enzyme
MGATETSLPGDDRLSERRPEPRETPRRRLLRKVLQVSVVRTLYLSTRFRRQIIVFRGTRVRLGAGARIVVSPGGRLMLGADDAGGGSGSVHIGPDGRLVILGKVMIQRSARILVFPGARLEMGHLTKVNCNAVVTCLDRITMGTSVGISWNTNILDGNAHVLIVAGVPRPRSEPIRIDDNAWIATGATVMGGVTVGAGAVVAAGSVVTADVPSRVVVAGNPARVIKTDVDWRA